jgi:hypothetical protein
MTPGRKDEFRMAPNVADKTCRLGYRNSPSLAEVTIVIESWRRHHNTVRPHGSLGYKSPVPEVIVPAITARAGSEADNALPLRVPHHWGRSLRIGRLADKQRRALGFSALLRC